MERPEFIQHPEPDRSGPVPAAARPIVPSPAARRRERSMPLGERRNGRSATSSGDASVEPRELSASLGRWGTRLGVISLALAVGTALFGGAGPSEEEAHLNYAKHIEPLEQANAASGAWQVRRVTRSGRWTHQDAVEVGSPMRQQTDQIRDLLAAGVLPEAQAAFASLQSVPEVDGMPVAPGRPTLPQRPMLTPGMQADLQGGDANLYRLFLYDNCAEDGDIVDVYIDGQRFCTVPITHEGSTLTVPATKGKMHVVELHGIRDGGGGITVAFRSSEGDYYTERMTVGQRQAVALVAR